MWQLLILMATISFAVARLLQRLLLKDGKLDAFTYSIYFPLLVALIILPIALLTNFAIPDLSRIWLQLLFMILLYAFANIFFYKAVARTPISEVMIIAATAPIWTTIISIFFLGYKLDFIKLLGVVLAVVGVFIVFYQKRKFKFHKGHYYAFLAQVFYGIALANDSYLLKHFSQTTYSFLYFFLPSLFIVLINPKKLSGIKLFITKAAGFKFLVPAILYAAGALLINTSFQIGAKASQVGVMLQLSPIFTVALGAIFLYERDNLFKKLVGGIIVIIGVLLI